MTLIKRLQAFRQLGSISCLFSCRARQTTVYRKIFIFIFLPLIIQFLRKEVGFETCFKGEEKVGEVLRNEAWYCCTNLVARWPGVAYECLIFLCITISPSVCSHFELPAFSIMAPFSPLRKCYIFLRNHWRMTFFPREIHRPWPPNFSAQICWRISKGQVCPSLQENLRME